MIPTKKLVAVAKAAIAGMKSTNPKARQSASLILDQIRTISGVLKETESSFSYERAWEFMDAHARTIYIADFGGDSDKWPVQADSSIEQAITIEENSQLALALDLYTSAFRMPKDVTEKLRLIGLRLSNGSCSGYGSDDVDEVAKLLGFWVRYDSRSNDGSVDKDALRNWAEDVVDRLGAKAAPAK